MGRKNSKTVTNSKTVAIDEKIGKWGDKRQKIVLSQLTIDTRQTKVFELVFRLSKESRHYYDKRI